MYVCVECATNHVCYPVGSETGCTVTQKDKKGRGEERDDGMREVEVGRAEEEEEEEEEEHGL